MPTICLAAFQLCDRYAKNGYPHADALQQSSQSESQHVPQQSLPQVPQHEP